MKDIKKDKCKIERHMTETHALPLETFAIYIYIYIYIDLVYTQKNILKNNKQKCLVEGLVYLYK